MMLVFAIAQIVSVGVEVLSLPELGLGMIPLSGIRTQPSSHCPINAKGPSAQSVAVRLLSTIRVVKSGSPLVRWTILNS